MFTLTISGAYNPTNAANYSAGVTGPMPRTTIKAADYGAVCNGINDDTAAINAALAALTTLIGGAGGSTVYGSGSCGASPRAMRDIILPGQQGLWRVDRLAQRYVDLSAGALAWVRW